MSQEAIIAELTALLEKLRTNDMEGDRNGEVRFADKGVVANQTMRDARLVRVDNLTHQLTGTLRGHPPSEKLVKEVLKDKIIPSFADLIMAYVNHEPHHFIDDVSQFALKFVRILDSSDEHAKESTRLRQC